MALAAGGSDNGRPGIRSDIHPNYYAAYLRDPDGVLAAYVSMPYLSGLLDKHDRGQHDATDRIWRLLNLQVWGDMFLTGRRDQLWDGLLKVAASSVQVA